MTSLQHPATKSLALAALGLFFLSGCGAAGDEAATDDESAASASEALQTCPPPVDTTIAVPAGNKLAFSYDATGAQIYSCQVSGTAYACSLVAPEANLLNGQGKVMGTLY